MTTYYISPVGLDSATGKAANAAGGGVGPWLTLNKAMNTGSPVVPGDTVYVAPGTYYATAAVPIVGVASTGSPTAIRGDYANAQGFTDRNGVRLDPGLILFTARTAAEGLDRQTLTTGTVVSGETNGTNGLQWYDVCFDTNTTGARICVTLTGNSASDWLFERCRFTGGVGIGMTAGAMTAARNTIVRACTFLCGQTLNASVATTAATADADLNILFEGCMVYGRLTGTLLLGSTVANVAGGIKWRGCTVLNCSNSTVAIQTTASGVSTVTPCRLDGCLIVSGVMVTAGSVGQVLSDGFNRWIGYSSNGNYTPAVTDVQDWCASTLAFHDLCAWGLATPMDVPLTWGPNAVRGTQKYSGWTYTGKSIQNRTSRPWGPGATIGAVEIADLNQDVGSALTGGGATSSRLTGAGEFSLLVPVDAVATTLTIVTASTAYGGASYPQMILEANPSVGLTQTTATATDATEQTLTIGPFTPTASGVVEVRLIARSTTTGGQTYFDVLQVT